MTTPWDKTTRKTKFAQSGVNNDNVKKAKIFFYVWRLVFSNHFQKNDVHIWSSNHLGHGCVVWKLKEEYWKSRLLMFGGRFSSFTIKKLCLHIPPHFGNGCGVWKLFKSNEHQGPFAYVCWQVLFVPYF